MSFVSDEGSVTNSVEVETPIIDNATFMANTEKGLSTAADSNITQANIDHYIGYALNRLLNENVQRKKTTPTNIITRISPFIEKYGVKSAHLYILLDLILSESLDQRPLALLVPLLLPRGNVSQKEIIRVFGSLSHRDYPLSIMQSLLQWVICVYDCIDGKEHITKLYGLLFHYLTVQQLRPQICHLLFLMTKKIHIKPYRARFLVDLAEKIHPEPQLIGLISVFRSYRPDLGIVSGYTNLKRNPFANADPKFESKIKAIRDLWIDETTAAPPNPSPENRKETASDRSPTKTERRQRKRTKQDDFLGIKLFKDDQFAVFNPSVILDYLDRQTILEQIPTILDNRMIQHVIVCNTDDAVIPRVCDILAQQLMDLVYWNRQSPESRRKLESLLLKILQLARFAKAHIPVVETFLERYLRSWNGIDFTKEIFELLTYIKPSSYEVLFECYLKPLYRLYCVSGVHWKARLILCYRDWLKNWALLDWYRHAERRKTSQDEGMADPMDSITWLFQGLSYNTDYFTVMQQMIYHVDRLCVQGLVLEEDHPVLQHACLSFFEFTASMSLQHDVPSITIPAASLVYRSFFSPNAMVVSRICGILHKYKLSFENNDRQAEDWMDKHSEAYLDHFNAYVLDICNCLWRNLAFDFQGEATTAFALTLDNVKSLQERCYGRGDALHLMFSLTHSSAFVGFSKQFMKIKAEELGLQSQEADIVTVESVKALVDIDGVPMSYMDYRVEYLDYLNDLGFYGVHDLLYTCMASLIKRKKQEQELEMEAEPHDIMNQ